MARSKKKVQGRFVARRPPNPPPPPPPSARRPASQGLFVVRIATAEDADAFIEGDPAFLAKSIQGSVEPIRARMLANGGGGGGGVADPSDLRALKGLYCLIKSVAHKATPGVLDKIADEQIDLWHTHVACILKKLTVDPRWTQTGVLQKYDQEMLDALSFCLLHFSAAARMYNDSEFLQVLSEFCAARAAPGMPCRQVAESIFIICNTLCRTLNHNGEKGVKILKKIEGTGLLAQALRCMTIPPICPQCEEAYRKFLDLLLIHCMDIRKKLAPGSKTGDMLVAILDGSDGYTQGPRHPEIKCRLENIAKMCEYGNNKEGNDYCIGRTNCQKCGKEDSVEKLSVCSRCKAVYYCSKECQVADWKEHKKKCDTRNASRKKDGWMRTTMWTWAVRNRFDIMLELDRVSRERDLPLKELVVLLDFVPGTDGIAPALKVPHPDFTIVATEDCLKYPGLPDWFRNVSSDAYYHNYLVELQKRHKHMTDPESKWTGKQVLLNARFSHRDIALEHIKAEYGGEGFTPLFSDEAVRAYAQSLHGEVADQVFPNLDSRDVDAIVQNCSGTESTTLARHAPPSLDLERGIEFDDETGLADAKGDQN